ncbi:class I SAM-dependent methyltransferase [Moheibacter stercoris]|uniref:2-polyprenyl-3-methyl-5-hydroxy-6-metoxy-1, 4-benzoquinol methylase n=1 Tax=Moheibacter stercoris TaxID=1628251 RepID=A0ABV2LSH6_9FLAO
MSRVKNSEIINFFSQFSHSSNFIDNLKIKYRALICPFDDLLEEIPKNSKIGDIGCGSGQFLLLAAEFKHPEEVFGIEISERLIENARNNFRQHGLVNSEFNVYNGEYFPDKLSEMDIVFLIDVLHHVPKAKQKVFLENLCKSLKTGATLVVKDIDAASPFVVFNKIHDLIFAKEIGNELSKTKTKNILLDSGMNFMKESYRQMYVYPHFTLVFKK